MELRVVNNMFAVILQYRHLIPEPVDRTFANALLYKKQ